MRNRRKLSVGMLVCVVGLVGLLSVGRAEAEKEQDDEHHRHKDRPERGLSLCLDRLVTCQTDLGACEAEPNVVFPGDGQEGTSLDFGLAHGPALSYTDNGDGTFTDNNTLSWCGRRKTQLTVSQISVTHTMWTTVIPGLRRMKI